MYPYIENIALCCTLAACGTTGVSGPASPAQSALTSATATNQPASEPSGGPASEVTRTLIAREDDAAMPGFESRIYLIEYPPGVAAQLHAHTEQTVGYVLEGRFESGFGNAPVTVTRAGEGFVETPHEPHRFRNPDGTRPLRFVVAGAFHKDEPLIQPLPGATGFASAPERTSSASTDAVLQVPGSSEERVTEVRRTLLAQKGIPDLPGLESRMYLVEFPPGAESKVHVHAAQGIGYVVEGTFESSFGDGPVTVKRAGDGFVDTPGKPHHFRNPDSARPLRFVFAGTFHKDEPTFQVVAQ